MVGILIAGVPAGGKTTFASVLSRRLRLPVFSKDSIKELLFDTVGFDSREKKVALGAGSFEILCYCAEAELRAGRSFILENNFEDSVRPAVEELFRRYRCPVVTVLFTGEPEAVYRRFVERDQSPGRHRGHVVNTRYPEPPGERTAAAYPSCSVFWESVQARGMDRFDFGDLVIRVDCTDLAALDLAALADRVAGTAVSLAEL